jgi:hypothetical protein
MNRTLLFCSLILFFASCNNTQNSTSDDKDSLSNQRLDTTSNLNVKLPFVGKKQFETRSGISGSGTPSRYVEVNNNGDVYFSFIQAYVDENKKIEERYYAGKFQTYLKCEFEKINEIRYYEITAEKIYEVDENHKRLTNAECCNSGNEKMGDKCPCEGEFSAFEVSQ